MEHHSFPGTGIPTAYGPYSHAVVAGDYVFVAGQTGRDPRTGHVIEGDVAAQTLRSLEIVREILSQLGLTRADIVRMTAYLADINDFVAMNAVYADFFPPPYPARSTVQVTLPFGALVGFEATAYRGTIRTPRSTG
jgi:2-iminobutanoate/2-iminopropanoate deaminase